MRKLFLASILALGLYGTVQAGSVAGGSYYRMLASSGLIVTGGGDLLGVMCSTPGSVASNNNQQFLQYFDTAPANGNTGIFAIPPTALTSIVSTNTITPQMVWPSTNTTSVISNGYDFSSWGGIHFYNGLFFYMNNPLAGSGMGCTTIWRKEPDY